MKKRFIILIDFSEYSENIIKYAYDMSLYTKAELIFIHQTSFLVPSFSDSDSKRDIIKEKNAESLKRLKELVKKYIVDISNVNFHTSEIDIKQTINKLLEQSYEHIIFTGTKKSSKLKQLFTGSKAVQVIDVINNTVLAIPKMLSSFNHQKILIGVTVVHPINILELNKFLSIVENKKIELTFFSIVKSAENTSEINKLLKNLAELFAEKFNTNTMLFEGTNPIANIRSIIKSNGSELLVVQKGSRMMYDKIFRKYLINELVYEGKIPMVIIP